MLRAYSKSEGTGKQRDAAKVATDTPSAREYATLLLTSFGHQLPDDRAAGPPRAERHSGLLSAAAGLTALTGHADGPPVPTPGHLTTCANGAVAAVAALAQTGAAALRTLDGAALLGERAAVLGRGRRGTTSVGGHCRLLRARDGWLAVNLPRAEDLATVPAWLECPVGGDPWDTITDVAADRAAGALVARARLLGLAAADASAPGATPPPWCRIAARGRRLTAPGDRPPLVLDLSTLWAGPLASHLLQLGGARVIKVESTARPDGARRGPARFFDLLHAGKESVALDFTSPTGRRALVGLVARADIVIESARPRAMHQLGIDPAALVRARPGLTWVSITGYGRRGHAATWIGFGDDAATAAGLANATGALAASATPLFCGDAIADPLTGMHAGVAALGAYRQGGGVLLALALRDVAAHALAFGPVAPPAEIHQYVDANGDQAWDVVASDERQRVLPPRVRPFHGSARPLGADTDALLRELHVG